MLNTQADFSQEIMPEIVLSSVCKVLVLIDFISAASWYVQNITLRLFVSINSLSYRLGKEEQAGAAHAVSAMGVG